MILATTRLHVLPEKQKEVVRTIRRILEPTRAETGCVDIQCSRDIEHDNTLIIQEQWASREDFERHVRSDDYRVMLSVLESASEEPSTTR